MSGIMDVSTGMAGNLGFGLPDLILIIFFFGGILLYVKGFKIGVVGHLILFSSAFLVFYFLGMDTSKAIILTFISLILMAFSLFMGKEDGGKVA